MKHTRRRHKVDHKTGEELEPKKTPKKEVTEVLLPPPAPTIPIADSSVAVNADPLLADYTLNKSEIADYTLNKSEEFFLQQNLLNIPLDDKFILQQQIDFINGKFCCLCLAFLVQCSVLGAPSNSMGLLVPYLQTSFQGHHSLSQQGNQQTALPLQLGDFIPVHYLHSLSTCD